MYQIVPVVVDCVARVRNAGALVLRAVPSGLYALAFACFLALSASAQTVDPIEIPVLVNFDNLVAGYGDYIGEFILAMVTLIFGVLGVRMFFRWIRGNVK
jgi:hypothetical protein